MALLRLLFFPALGEFCYTLGVIFDQVHRHMAVALSLLLENAFVISLINQYTLVLWTIILLLCTCLVVSGTLMKFHTFPLSF
jgi:hypothetical protein